MLIEGELARVVRHLDRTDPDELRRPVTGKLYPLTLPTLQQMLSNGEPLVIPNTKQDAMWRQLDQTDWINAYAATPLQVHGQIIGFLNMNSDQTDFFTADIIPRLQAFANTAAAAIQNARLYRSTQQYAADLENRVRERTQEAEAAKERIEHILISVPDAIFVLDEDNQLVQANPAGEGLVLQAREQGIDIFSQEFIRNLTDQSALTEKTVLQINPRAYQALASSLDVNGRKTGTVVVFRDVTRFRELDEMKTQFISDVSHELRTPLTNLALYLDLLAKVKDPEKSQRYLETLRREMQRLTSLIEDLLTISRLEAGRMEIYIEPVDANRIVADMATDRMQMAANQELHLSYTIQPDLPPVMADERLLTHVLSNLLTNALTYTPPKQSIHMQTETEPGDGFTWVKISVKDTGLGIAPEEMEYLFSRFFRGSASQTTNAPGTGLGLAISKEIIQRFEGRITVESQLHKGSTFTVWLKAAL
jgi:signal transduction histidine kinase